MRMLVAYLAWLASLGVLLWLVTPSLAAVVLSLLVLVPAVRWADPKNEK